MARPSPLDVYALLDKSNCGDCGYDTCMAFATDLLERKIRLEDCTHLMQDKKQQKNLRKLKEITTPPQKPVRIGVGERQVIIGGEEVLMRHQLTYYNPTGIFVEVADDQEDLIDVVKYLTDLKIERMGEALTLDGIALRCVSQNGDSYKDAAKKVVQNTDLPVMLCCLEPEFLIGAAEEIKDKNPALYAATKDTWEKVGTFAVQNNLPIVATSSDLDELMGLSATLQKLGSDKIILDAGTFFGPGNLSITYDNIIQLRIAGIDKENVNAGLPIMGVPAAYWTQTENIKDDNDIWRHKYQEIIMGSIMESIDTSLIVVHTGQKKEDIWALLALMTLRQSIFSDPRVYPAVDPGVYEIGEPGPNAPIFVTSNYRLTKIPVEIDVKGADLDAYLLVVDSEGIGIESAVAGGQFSAGAIAEATKEFKVFDKVDHRILIIPGMAARLSGALEDEADAYVLVGPRDSSGIGSYIKKKWKPEEYMKEYAER
ncbi:MAG: acetyl-CoA decarbonylase/synthase complex subunit gamma [Candidatus Lokiarchaeota archaeon]|nr:acetyl-CoA decarbonylase/synthase complex subunit gamma [Candidatus Lokiarchaeota archaeon]MBD3202272.1 acetyl-CoA decarbonylase/synthase complex subunit gamma [Candidatus Lokiarchaeota archaeon]